MKLGLIADIHADVESLQLALNLLAEQSVDEIICAGDLVGKGPHSDDVIQILRAKAILCIAGNHDYEALQTNSLTNDAISFLQQLPAKAIFTRDGQRILLAHGAPWSDIVYIYPTTERHVFQRIARDSQADIVILGHTHVPFSAQVRKVRIYNPGSVCGIHTSGSRTCGILTLPAESFQIFEISTKQQIDIPYVHIIH